MRRYLLVGLSLAITGAVFFYYFKTWSTIEAFVRAMDHCDLLFCDFVRHYYVMGQNFFSLKAPVGGFFYSPFFALVLTLFSRVPLATALWGWGIFQVLTTTLLFLLPAAYFLKKKISLYYLYLFLFIISFPILHNFKWGQVSVLITLCVLGTLYFYRRGGKMIPAVLLALSMAIKYYTGIFIVYFLIKKDFRFTAVFLVALFIFMAVIPSLAIGVKSNFEFYREINKNIDQFKTWVANADNSQYLGHVIPRISNRINGRPLLHLLLAISGVLVFLGNIFLVYRLRKIVPDPDDEIYWSFILLFLSFPLILETSWPHYFVYLPFCITFLAGAAVDLRDRTKWPLWVLTAAPAVLSSSIFFNINGNWLKYSRSGYLFFADVLLLIICYIHLFKFRFNAHIIKHK